MDSRGPRGTNSTLGLIRRHRCGSRRRNGGRVRLVRRIRLEWCLPLTVVHLLEPPWIRRLNELLSRLERLSGLEILLARLERLSWVELMLTRLKHLSLSVLGRHHAPLRVHDILRLAILLGIPGGEEPRPLSVLGHRCLGDGRLGYLLLGNLLLGDLLLRGRFRRTRLR